MSIIFIRFYRVTAALLISIVIAAVHGKVHRPVVHKEGSLHFTTKSINDSFSFNDLNSIPALLAFEPLFSDKESEAASLSQETSSNEALFGLIDKETKVYESFLQHFIINFI